MVGFVGLGSMGLPLAERISLEYELRAYDTDRARVALLGAAEAGESVSDIARTSDVVCLCLPSKQASQSVVKALAATTGLRVRIVVEMSTLGPTCVKENAHVLDAAGIKLVDAPVSGGVAAAAEGRLAAMVAGDRESVETVKPILDQVAANIFPMGEEPGLGQVMKLTNNIIALSVLPLTSEALLLGLSHGLEIQRMIDVINASSGRTQRSEVVFPRSIIPETFDHGATGEIAGKDVNLFVEAAEEAHSPMRIAPIVNSLYQAFVERHPQTDYSYLHRFIQAFEPDEQ